MDAVFEIVVIEPGHDMPVKVAARNWKVGDVVDVRGIKPALAKKNSEGLYIPQNPIIMRRSRYIFIKGLPDIGIKRLREILCNDHVNILDQDSILGKREWQFKLNPYLINKLINEGHLNFDFTVFMGRMFSKRLGRLIDLGELHGST